MLSILWEPISGPGPLFTRLLPSEIVSNSTLALEVNSLLLISAFLA